VVVPFTLRAVLLWHTRTGERAKGLAAAPLQSGSRQRKSPLRGALSLFLPASGRAPACIHAGYALSAHPCASPRPPVNASAIFSRTSASLEHSLFQRQCYGCDMSWLGFLPLPVGEGWGEVSRPHRPVPSPLRGEG